MAKLPALIETLEVFHPEHDAAAIRYAARALRHSDLGLLSAGAGGRGAPDMTPRDAVNLLLALNLTQTPSQYGQAALLGSALSRTPQDQSFAADTPSVVIEALTASTLGHALHVLIVRAEELAPPRLRADLFADPDSGQVRDERPAVLVQLTRHGNDLVGRVDMFWKAPRGLRRLKALYGAAAAKPGYGRWTTINFDQAVLLALKRTVVAAPPWAFEAERGHQ
nr:hypothetical protein [uncultured Brevundimonas sp.]